MKLGRRYWTGPRVLHEDTSPVRERAWVFVHLTDARRIADLFGDAKVFRLVRRKARR